MNLATPKTPPASARKSKPQKAPHFDLPVLSPYTPHKRKGVKVQLQLQTPAKTPRNDLTTRNERNSSNVSLGLLQTPEITPRSSRKKKPINDLLVSSEPISLLIPNHLTVGSGRRSLGSTKMLKPPPLLDFAELSRLNLNLTFEEDDFASNALDQGLDPEGVFASPSKPPRKKSLVFSTPGRQIITQELVEEWHGKSRGHFSSDEDENSTTPLVNPFLEGKKSIQKRKTVFQSKSPVDYATHSEFLNHRTGERKVVELTSEQREIGPRRLDFSGL